MAIALSADVDSSLLAALAGRPLSSLTVCATDDDPDADEVFGGYLDHVRPALVRQHLELVDKYSMASGVEVRLPYLDAHVYESGLALTSGSRLGETGTVRKRLLREMLAERMPAGSAGILAAPKRGFPASGIGLLRGFARYCAEHVPERYARRHELAPVYDRTYQLVLFDMFRHIMLDGRGHVPDGFRLADFLAACQ